MNDRQRVLQVIVEGMQIALLEKGECSVMDGYALLSADEWAFAKERQLGQVAVRILRDTRHLRKADVVNSKAPSRRGGYVARWTR